MPTVTVASSDDLPAWRLLAREVEPLFGPMVGLPAFEEALARTVSRGQALCVREADGGAGAPLLGGLLWSSHPPRYQIGWLAVTARARRLGVGRQLVAAALALAEPPATVDVVTFGDDAPGGLPARRFYAALGFAPAEVVPPGPEGGSRQVFRLSLRGRRMGHVAVREARRDDEAFLWEMLVQAAHMADDDPVEAARRHPFLAKFVRGWGRPGDLGVVAHDAGGERPLGAAWLRHLTGAEQSYPAVDPAYPELAIAVRPACTGHGIGGLLLRRLIALAGAAYPGVVLSVRADSPARRLYERHGFVVTGEIVNRVGTRSHVMELRLLP